MKQQSAPAHHEKIQLPLPQGFDQQTCIVISASYPAGHFKGLSADSLAAMKAALDGYTLVRLRKIMPCLYMVTLGCTR